jgi:hypothetical protein
VDSCPLQASGTGRYKENRNKITKMQEDLSSKEHKWTAALSKLQEQVETQREQKLDHKDAGGSQQQGTQLDSCPLQASGTGRYKEHRNKITKMQEDLSSKEHKWTAALSKLQEQVEIQENRNKNTKMQEDLSSKEHKWTAALSKLQEQVEIQENRNKTSKMQDDLSSKEHKWTAALSNLQDQVKIQREKKQDHKDAGGSQQQGTQVDSCTLQASGTGRDTKITELRSQRCRRISTARKTSLLLPCLSFRNR